MYPTGYTPRSGNFSNGYPKPGFETNMPSIHSAVPGTGYGAASPYRTSWGTQGMSFDNSGVKMSSCSEVFDSRVSVVGKQMNGYGSDSGWVCNSATEQRMCYGECKRSGRICVTCQEYAQYNYGMQTVNSRCSSQFVSPAYPQRHPNWQEGQNMAPQKFSPSNGYNLPRSNSESSGYAMNSYNIPYQQTNSPHWGSKTTTPGDALRRINPSYTNGYNHGQHNHARCSETDNWQSNYRMSSCDINSQKVKAQMRPMAGGAMGPHHRHNAVNQQNSHFNQGMNWNGHINTPEMPNSQCTISQDRLMSTRQTCANRPEQLPARASSFPTTPPSNAHGCVVGENPMGSCQLSQLPHPGMSSPPRPQRSATFWDSPSSITKQGIELEKFQYTSTNNASTPVNTNSQFQQSVHLNGQSPLDVIQTCPGIPQNCDLSARAWQKDIVDLNPQEFGINDKAPTFSYSFELEKLAHARLSKSYESDELDFSSATNTDTSGTSDASRTTLAPSHVASREESRFDEPAANNAFSPRTTDFKNLEQSKLPCVSESNILPQQVHDTNTQSSDASHDNKSMLSGSSSVTSADSPNEDGDGKKLKKKHTDYLNQTSDVNPYGTQNCIAALSASCRKMIADMDKPDKDSDQGVSQQPMCVPSFPDGSPNSVTNSSCYGRPYANPSHPHSFPVDPFTLHYPQGPQTNSLNGTVIEKSRRGRKRKNAVSRSTGHSTNRGYENQESCKKSSNAVSSQENLGNDFEGPPRSPHRHGSETDLGNISPTFSDGPVSIDMLESVFSPDNSLPSATNDFSTMLESTSNTHLSHSFSDFGHVSPPNVTNNGNIVSSSTRCLSSNVTSCQPASTTPSLKERHPLEILKDQIKIQRQQFSLDGPLENGPTDFNERNNNKPDESGRFKTIHHDVNDNHVIEARS